MFIDLIHTQPLFRDAPDSLAVKYTHPDTGVNIEIPYEDLVNTVIAVDEMLSSPQDVEPDEEDPGAVAEELVEEQVLSGAPSGLRVRRTVLPDDAV